MKTFFYNREKIKRFLLIVFALFLLIVSNKSAKSAVSISSPLCAGPTADVTMPAPMHTLRYSCSVVISGTAGSAYDLGVYVPDYITTWVSGHGSTITYTSPDALRYRFRADGAVQSGNSENITTSDRGSAVAKLINNIAADGTYTFDLLYDTYEADYGGTSYSQSFTLGLYKTEGNPDASVASSLSFTIGNWLYIYKYVSPTVSVSSTPDFFEKNTYYDADQILIEIAANNEWIFKITLSGDLSSGSDTASVSDNYFKISGTGFVNLASSYKQLAVANEYYDAAENTVGEYYTGTSDNKSLSKKSLYIIYGFKNSNVYVPGSYTTTVKYRLTNP